MKIIFGSDISFSHFRTFGEKRDAAVAFSEAAVLFKQADFSMVNLENIFGKEEEGTPIIKSGPNLISDDAFIEYIHALQPSIVGMANNHSKDYGEGLLYHTIEMFVDSGYACIGAGKNTDEAYRPVKLTKDGVNVAIIAVCENEFGTAGENMSGTAGYKLGRLTSFINQALQENYKPIIYFHGGNERNPFPSPGKVELYRHFIDIGAEAVIAMHTHCPQGYEIYKDKPIVYSMGNFFFPIHRKEHKSWFYGYMSELNISDQDISLLIHPYTFNFERLTLLKDAEKDAFKEYMKCLCDPIQNEKEIQELFDSWCFMTRSYTHQLEQYRKEMFTDGQSEEVKHLKNVFSCEAHNELVKNTLEMMYESRVEAAESGMERIRKLQEMEELKKKPF